MSEHWDTIEKISRTLGGDYISFLEQAKEAGHMQGRRHEFESVMVNALESGGGGVNTIKKTKI